MSNRNDQNEGKKSFFSQFVNLGGGFAQPIGSSQQHVQPPSFPSMTNSQLLYSIPQPSTQNYHGGSSNDREYQEQVQHFHNTQNTQSQYHEQHQHFQNTQSQYHEQHQHFQNTQNTQNTQSQYRTPEPVKRGSSSRGKEKEVTNVNALGYKKSWEKWEDVILAKAFANYTDSMIDTKMEIYWGDVLKMYNEDVLKRNGVPRDSKALQNRWHRKMSPQCSHYIDCYKRVMGKAKSGENEVNMLKRVDKDYAATAPLAHKKFQMGHVYHILMNCAKFSAKSTAGTYPVMDNVNLDHLCTPQQSMHDSADTPGSDQYSSHGSASGKRKSSEESNTDEVHEVNSPAKSGARPHGVKKQKLKAQRRLAGISEGVEQQVEKDSRMRELEASFQQSRLQSFDRCQQNKTRQIILNMLAQSKELADTPEELAEVKRQHKMYLKQWMIEDNLV